jgi:hypothetical protein
MKIIISLVFVLSFVVMANAHKTKIIKGFMCIESWGSSE